MIDTVPRALTPELLAFCAKLSPHRPRFIPSKPAKDAEASGCFDNVASKISRAGGSTAYGWAIWSHTGLYHEAEHHGAWRRRGGDLVDVSPQLNGARRILFLPDERATYDPNEPRPNVIEAASHHPAVVELVELQRERYAIEHAYRVGGNRLALFTITDQRRLGEIERRSRELWPTLPKRA